MLLSYDELTELQELGIVEYSDPELVNATSIDIRLGANILVERPDPTYNPYEGKLGLRRISLRKREPLLMAEHDLRQAPFILYPGEFILAQSHEVFNLPDHLSAMYCLKSSMARVALEHLNAGWCDAGWHGSVLTMEFKNISRYHEIELTYLDLIGQMVFFKHRQVPRDRSYAVRGNYNKHSTVMGVVTRQQDEERVAANVLINNDEEED